MDDLTLFRLRMKETRIVKHITLKEIADKIGVKEATVQRYESGKGIKSVPYENIVGIASALNVSPAYLLGWEDNLNESTADLYTDLIADTELLGYVKKIHNLDLKDRQMIYDFIDRLSGDN